MVPGTEWEGSNWEWLNGHYTGYQSTMPGQDMSISTGNNGNTRRVLKYYLEDPDGIVQYKGKTFSEMTTVVLKLSSGANPTYEEEFFVIDGYERFGSNVSPWEDGDKIDMTEDIGQKETINSTILRLIISWNWLRRSNRYAYRSIQERHHPVFRRTGI